MAHPVLHIPQPPRCGVAVIVRGTAQVCRLVRFSLTTANLSGLARFYESAFGFRILSQYRDSGSAFETLMGVTGGANSAILGLGQERLELLEYDYPGRPYPPGATSSDLTFQHFAIVAANIEAAYRRLLTVTGWTAISCAGPEQLPASSGGVLAFKFRDPEGHPLELLGFPQRATPLRWLSARNDDTCLGIDHSAVSVRDTARSIAFYRGMGLRRAGHTLNRGPEQERLDALKNPDLEVNALEPRHPSPHIELLCYRSARHAATLQSGSNDIASTRLVLETDESRSASAAGLCERCIRDPDGHQLQLLPPQIRHAESP